MKNKNFAVIIVATVCLIVFLAGNASAAQQSAVTKVPVQRSATVKPLQQPLAIKAVQAPGFCALLQQTASEAKQLAEHDLYNATNSHQMVNTSCNITFTGVYIADHYTNYCCSQDKNFSVQEQQAAGCVSSETLQQCMDKLVRKCIKDIDSQKGIRTYLKESQQKADNIAAKSKQLSDKINKLMTLWP